MSDGMTEMYKRESKAKKNKKPTKEFCKKAHKYVEKDVNTDDDFKIELTCTNNDRVKQLVNAHWEYNGEFARKLAYLIAGMYSEVKESDPFIERILEYSEFVYKTSGKHFYGHAVEDMEGLDG